MVDNRNADYSHLTVQDIYKLCDRRFGIGGDGFMLLSNKDGYDFEMIYHNADGNIGSMCGNGGRCIVRFAHDLGIYKNEYNFVAPDGPHIATIDGELVALKMSDVSDVQKHNSHAVLNTGSPHYVQPVSDIENIDVVQEGRKVRYSKHYSEKGINVNFVEVVNNSGIKVRTYERGVEDETYSCGTGVTAAALVNYHNDNGFNSIDIETKGGKINVSFERNIDGSFKEIWLKGPAVKVFEGDIEI